MAQLTLVPTPVGNLEDITLRSIRALKEADLILAEDTRTSSKLLKHLGISKPMKSYHAHNEHKVLEDIVSRIASGENIALISDAGTPGISDPGFLVVRECIRNDIKVETLPGPTAFVPALINSGLPSDRFCFEGFLPQKKGRHSRIENLKDEQRTMIFYESPFRLVKALEQFAEAFGADRQASVSRELSKIHEENFRGSLAACVKHFSSKTVKGEIVIVIAGKTEKENSVLE
ncbi:MAG: 16S rRNA (cytidine(1402)-2'-O)-methyltransferase [Bacteroidetes bacterium]|nr:MAG: 16S rRNA (cytidine(1402)-2'-O)-methyltransferase [Bacteroidota bacterium]REK04750.1 MAG: 16S rRNA (cytidine(1402)-2'-O)-methyltransferase [Bacteroidota bacterium]REK36224.1 MAG: 16S rRNA (cytidine(1402)-2'-O)-methyltransferase [Bacteroidota bacterium]REK51114.1 MAG: 16S rRNA (cytidine(1402)-2'-O)-methyltransferase [Bacteroidota bacterium]